MQTDFIVRIVLWVLLCHLILYLGGMIWSKRACLMYRKCDPTPCSWCLRESLVLCIILSLVVHLNRLCCLTLLFLLITWWCFPYSNLFPSYVVLKLSWTANWSLCSLLVALALLLFKELIWVVSMSSQLILMRHGIPLQLFLLQSTIMSVVNLELWFITSTCVRVLLRNLVKVFISSILLSG
jgi:hypothetical protein